VNDGLQRWLTYVIYKSILKRNSDNTWVRARLCKLQKGCTRLAAASDKVYQLLAHGRWFSPGTPASSTTKTGRHDIAEILLVNDGLQRWLTYVIYKSILKRNSDNTLGYLYCHLVSPKFSFTTRARVAQ
jgi:AAA+ ATPase superfamily predicted ATPase